MSDPLSLEVGPARYPLEHAELSLRLQSDSECSSPGASGRSGGVRLALCLELRLADPPQGIEALLDVTFLLPTEAPAELEGYALEGTLAQAEAWWGQDASALSEQRLELRSALSESSVDLAWAAVTAPGAPLRLEGRVPFAGLSLTVHQVSEAESLLRQAWAAVPLDRLELVGETELEFDSDPEGEDEGDCCMELHYRLR